LAEDPIYIPVRRRRNSREVERTSLRTFLESKCPSLFREYRSAWWLFNGHLQTAYAVVGDFSAIDKVVYDRKLLRLKDGGTIGLDFTPPTSEQVLSDETPIVVILHGLSGGSHESYVRAILSPVIAPVEEGGLGYRGVVVNFRGCAGVTLTTAQLYSAGHTDDIRQALMYLSYLYPKAPLLGVGFSLGANVLVKYLAQEGEQSRLASGCALGCPWDLVKNSDHLETTWLQRNIYSKGMGHNLRQLIMRHAATIATFPESALALVIPEVLSLKTPRLIDFDSKITAVAGGSSPPFPFPSARHYYRWGSSHNVLKDVAVPLLTINADDDPVVRAVPTGPEDNKWVVMVTTSGGGHLGWFETSGNRLLEVKRWVSKPVGEWLRANEEIVLDHRRDRALSMVDGWLVEHGRETLGCREIEGCGTVQGAEGQGGMLAGL